MMKTIFFDLDDTLYFRRDAFFLAFDEFFGGKHANVKVFANDRCRIRGDEVFFKCQNGEITELEMYIFRFKTGFADAGIEINREQAEDFYKLYKKHLYSMKLNPQVVSMLDFAKAHFENLGIILLFAMVYVDAKADAEFHRIGRQLNRGGSFSNHLFG